MNIKPIKIGKKTVGNNHPCYIIAEIGSNFNGDLSLAKKLIKLAKKCGADAAKFQVFTTENLISRKGFEQKNAFQKKWKKSVWDVYKNAEFPRDWHSELNSYSKKIGIDFFTSPWDFDAVDSLVKLKAPAIKIGSGDITYLEILKYIGSKNLPILLATGASTLEEISIAVKTIKSTGNNKIILMQSITQYPSKISDANLKVLQTFKNKFNLNVGYSDHSPGSLVSLSSVALGACVIEKHFTLDPTMSGPDHPHSMSPDNFESMVKEIRTLENALGTGIKKVETSEKQTRVIQRRGIWTIKPIKKGEKFTRENIRSLRPVKGLSSSNYEQLLGKISKCNLKEFHPMSKNDL
ncbi:MAG: N-acetylneuraminate synthase family protein [Candidatus Nitrosopumilus sp. bin_32a]